MYLLPIPFKLTFDDCKFGPAITRICKKARLDDPNGLHCIIIFQLVNIKCVDKIYNKHVDTSFLSSPNIHSVLLGQHKKETTVVTSQLHRYF